MKASLFIARHLSLKRRLPGEKRSPAVTIATIGIALSVTVMMLTIAIVPGFKHEITRKVMSFDAQLSAQPVAPLTLDSPTANPAILSDSLRSIIHNALPEAQVTLNIKLPGLLKTPDHFSGLIFQAFSEPATLDFIAENLKSGAIPDYTADSTRYDLIVSEHTARQLDLNVGDRIDGYFFTNDNLRARKFNIAAIYDSHFNDFDRLICFTSYQAACALAEFEDGQGNSIQLRGLKADDIPSAAKRLENALSGAFHSGITGQYLKVADVFHQNPMYFNWLDLLDTNVNVIIILMGIVGAITLISCLFIIILERVQLIGTLKALGTTNGALRHIFLIMAERIVVRGIVTGDIISLIIIALQARFNFLPLDPESYYLSSVPVEYNWSGFIVLNISTALLALAVMLLPVMTISRIAPARAMRFE